MLHGSFSGATGFVSALFFSYAHVLNAHTLPSPLYIPPGGGVTSPMNNRKSIGNHRRLLMSSVRPPLGGGGTVVPGGGVDIGVGGG